MQNIQIRLQFVAISFKTKPKKPFAVRLTAEKEDGSVDRSAEIMMEGEQAKMDEIGAFEVSFVATHDRAFCPSHSIYFTVERTPSIRRRIPLHLSDIYDHHLAQDLSHLDRIYAFEDGKILYHVTIVDSSEVSDPNELEQYELKIGLYGSTRSSRIQEYISQSARVSRAESIGMRVKPRPSFEVQDDQGSEKLEGQETMDLEESSEKGEGRPSYLESWHEFSQMEKEHSRIEAATRDETKLKSHKGGFPLKIIITLIVIGFLLLAFDAYQEPKLKKIKESSKAKRKQDKVVRERKKEKAK